MVSRRVWVLGAFLLLACSGDAATMGDAASSGDAGGDGVMQVISCPSTAMTCARTTQICCATGSGAMATFACVPWSGGCNGGCGETTTPIKCDGNGNCAALGAVCCGQSCDGSGVTKFDWIQCVPIGTCDPMKGQHQVCASTNLAQCRCSNPKASADLSGYSFCP